MRVKYRFADCGPLSVASAALPKPAASFISHSFRPYNSKLMSDTSVGHPLLQAEGIRSLHIALPGKVMSQVSDLVCPVFYAHFTAVAAQST